MYYNINILNRLTAVKAEIKSENRSTKQELSDEYRNMERMFQPVVGPLRQLANSQASINKPEILVEIQKIDKTYSRSMEEYTVFPTLRIAKEK